MGRRGKNSTGRHALHPRGGGSMTMHRAGEPLLIGRLKRPHLPFALAQELTAKGALPLCAAVQRVIADWKDQVVQGLVVEGTVGTHSRVLRTMCKYMTARGVVNLADVTTPLLWDWVEAVNSRTSQEVTDNMRLLRREVAKAFYVASYRLGLTDANIAVFPRERRPARFVSPLSPKQIQKLKNVADYEISVISGTSELYERGSLKPPVALALALLGAQPGEIGYIRVRDVDLLEQKVWASGGGKRFRPRWLPIDDSWAFGVLVDRIAYLAKKSPDDHESLTLAYEPNVGKQNTFANRSAATSTSLDKLLVKAGVKRKGIRAGSILESLAVRIFNQTRRVEAVAARLGMASLDGTAHLVGYDWPSEFQPVPGEPGDPK